MVRKEVIIRAEVVEEVILERKSKTSAKSARSLRKLAFTSMGVKLFVCVLQAMSYQGNNMKSDYYYYW